MFGYIGVNQPEMKIKDFTRYRQYYCGLCRALKEEHGLLGRLSLSYDMTFVAMVLSALYEPKDKVYRHRCPVHPWRKQYFRENPYLSYTADMNILLTYFKCLDDWHDDHTVSRLLYAWILKPGMRKVRKKYPEKEALIRDRLEAIQNCENAGETQPDIPAGLFGDIMAELFVFRKDAWEEDLRQMGFFLGKYIYLLDAWDDLVEDKKKGNYNVFLYSANRPDFQNEVKQMLTLMMGECAKAFERLPILRDADILRNIIYSGVWTKFAVTGKQKKRKKS